MRETSAVRRRLHAVLTEQVVSGAVSGVLVGAVLASRPSRPAATVREQLITALRDTAVMIVPTVLAGTIGDRSVGPVPHLGKRAHGLVVHDGRGRRIGAGRALVSNTLKVLPWQLAHLGVRQQVSRVGGRAGEVLGTTALLGALLGAGADVVVLLCSGRSLHDRLAGTVVLDASAPRSR